VSIAFNTRARFARWIRRRQGEDSLPAVFHRKRIYVLPTRGGLLFGLMLLLMLVAGLNYANSIALFLTFMLAGLALVAMHRVHRNLLHIELLQSAANPAFAGQGGALCCSLRNTSRLTRHGVVLSRDRERTTVAALPPFESVTLELPVPTERRGVIQIDRVRISTRFPFGLFEAWTYVHRPFEIVVYPRAEGSLPPPPEPGGVGAQRAALAGGDDEWLGLRAFRDGDSPRQVAWKAYARGAPLLVKEYGSVAGTPRVFDFDSLRGLALEARLSQLCRWVVDSEARGHVYALRLPGVELPPGRGLLHQEHCLTALARC